MKRENVMKNKSLSRLYLVHIFIYAIFVSSLAVTALAQERKRVNLVPSKPADTFNYWCTWSIQYYQGGNINEVKARQKLTEGTVFGPQGWANVIHPRVKSDLYLVLDDGWDLPLDQNQFEAYYGSMLVDNQRWPSCTGSPDERLRKLNQMAQACGWKGVGLWICAQESKACVAREKEDFLKNHPDAAPSGELDAYAVHYWTERLQWTRSAGVRYWKVDWGEREASHEFRQWLTQTARRIAPDLIVEHAWPRRPFNENFDANGVGQLDNDWVANAAKCIQYADVFRLYDQSDHLGVPIMLERISRVLDAVKAKPQSRALLQCEHEVYMAGVLGLNIGEMRHQFIAGPDVFFSNPRQVKKRLDEVARALRWQRLAPPFGAGVAAVETDTTILFDEYNYDDKSFWTGKGLIRQGAPGRISRGLPLPDVQCDGWRPFVIAGRNPNGAAAVAAFGRLFDNNTVYRTPRADITLKIGENSGPIGIFGYYKKLTLQFDKPLPTNLHILAQDLAGDEAEDVTTDVAVVGNQITLPGELIEKIGLSAKTPDDLSDPGLVLIIR
jgi:hypothetical protein